MTGRHVFPSVAGVWLLIGVAALFAQSQGAPGVTFQTEVTYVDVDASVTDEQGQFVANLTKEDFQVFEDGKPQKIDTFSLVEIPLERAGPLPLHGEAGPIRRQVQSPAVLGTLVCDRARRSRRQPVPYRPGQKIRP